MNLLLHACMLSLKQCSFCIMKILWLYLEFIYIAFFNLFFSLFRKIKKQ